jgi:hypothetical protein
MSWLKRLFFDSTVEYLAPDWCDGKSNKELSYKLKHGYISHASGNMIVSELLERLVNITEPK